MNSKQDAENLMNALLPVAEKMLRQYGEFYPFGGYMKPDGTIVHIGVTDEDTDHPKSTDLLYVLRSSLKDMSRANECKAVAVVIDVAVILPNSTEKSDAIQVCLEHLDNYSAEIFLPYRVVEGRVVYGETFAQKGKGDVFDQT